MKYRRLTQQDRYQIEALLTIGKSYRTIARQLNRNPTTIVREIKKGRIRNGAYSASRSEKVTHNFRRAPKLSLRIIKGDLEEKIRGNLFSKWSPVQISESFSPQRPLSYQTIYRYIFRDKEENGELWKHLRILRRQRKNRKNPRWKPGELMIRDRKMINERPNIVERRVRIGDFERDTMLGKVNKPLILALVDRTSRLVKLAWIKQKKAQEVHEATVKILKKEVVRTITNDNGSEFSFHKLTSSELNTQVYFSRAFRAWERGTVENTIGLLRQYFPRKKDIGYLKPKEIKQIEDELNNRPRKCLGFKTPAQVHKQLRSGVALDM